jgi:hypothetical protein
MNNYIKIWIESTFSIDKLEKLSDCAFCFFSMATEIKEIDKEIEYIKENILKYRWHCYNFQTSKYFEQDQLRFKIIFFCLRK